MRTRIAALLAAAAAVGSIAVTAAPAAAAVPWCDNVPVHFNCYSESHGKMCDYYIAYYCVDVD